MRGFGEGSHIRAAPCLQDQNPRGLLGGQHQATRGRDLLSPGPPPPRPAATGQPKTGTGGGWRKKPGGNPEETRSSFNPTGPAPIPTLWPPPPPNCGGTGRGRAGSGAERWGRAALRCLGLGGGSTGGTPSSELRPRGAVGETGGGVSRDVPGKSAGYGRRGAEEAGESPPAAGGELGAGLRPAPGCFFGGFFGGSVCAPALGLR